MTRPLTTLLARAEWPDPVLDAATGAGWPKGILAQFCRLGVLAESGPAAVARCDACGFDHIEPVRWVDEAGVAPRAYLVCPREGLIRVPVTELARWTVQLPRLARLVGEVVGATGAFQECVPGRAWRLGVVRVSGRVRPAVLLAGLYRPDADGVVARVAELSSAAAIAFVPARVPSPSIWAGVRPAVRPAAVLPLTDLLDWGPDGLRADPAVLASALDPAGITDCPAPATFPTPVGATWDQVRLTIGDHHITIRVGDITRRLGFAEAGFEDHRRRGVPNQGWQILTQLARAGGVLGTGDRIRTKPAALKTKVSDLRDRLRALLGVDGDPFFLVRKGQPYRARFKISPSDPGCVPTPPGTTWADVALREAPAGGIEVVVAAVAPAVRRPGRDNDSGEWESATEAGDRMGIYRLADWHLADPTGHPNSAGAALLAVLRGCGRTQRPKTDPAMLALGSVLTDVFRLNGAPFEFDSTTGTWISSFDAGRPVDR